jgi:hypothetical protein
MNKSKDVKQLNMLCSCLRNIPDFQYCINLYNIDIELMGTIEYIVSHFQIIYK